MTATQHTQGSWEVTAEHIITGNSEYLAWLDESTVAEPEWRANARLIASAPDLLAALQRIADPGAAEQLTSREIALAAIAKAGFRP